MGCCRGEEEDLSVAEDFRGLPLLPPAIVSAHSQHGFLSGASLAGHRSWGRRRRETLEKMRQKGTDPFSSIRCGFVGS